MLATVAVWNSLHMVSWSQILCLDRGLKQLGLGLEILILFTSLAGAYFNTITFEQQDNRPINIRSGYVYA